MTTTRLDLMDPGALRWNADDYYRSSSAQSAWGREVHDRIVLRGDERVLDLGCGDGRLTVELAERVSQGSVVGLDSDVDMIEFARRHHARHNVDFIRGDARRFSLEHGVELVISTACLHWVDDIDAVLRCCRATLEPGGRIYFQGGGRGNCAEFIAAVTDIARRRPWAQYLEPFTSPWFFRGPEDFERVLPRCGFRPIRLELVEKDTVHDSPEALTAWFRTTWMPVLGRVPEALQSELIDEIVSRHVERRPLDPQGRTHADMVRLDVEAVAT